MQEDIEDQELQLIDFNNAIEALNEISEIFKVDVWIPSKQSYLQFKEIDTKQQKDMLGSAMDSSVYNTTFIGVFYEILKQNILEKDKTIIDDLTIYDKASIAIYLKNQISNELNVIFDDKNNISAKINLNDIIEKFKVYKTPKNEIIKIVNKNVSLAIEVGLPTVLIEIQHDKQMSKNYKKSNQVKNNDDVKNIISDAFIVETSKYIKKIWINDSEVDLNSDRIDQKLKIIEKMPSVIIQKVLEQISKWKKEIDDILIVEHEDYKKVIGIDSLLFLT
jgi:hypothetical protein